MEFGERIRAVRTGAGLTQEQFASRLGVTRQAVSNWENGRNLPDIEVVIAISQTFGVSLDELILGGEDMTRTTGEQNDMADKLIRDGSEGRWMRMSLAMSIVGAVLILVAAVLAVVAENSVSYVDASGMLHEDFWLVPVSYACAAAGMLVLLANFVAQLREVAAAKRPPADALAGVSCAKETPDCCGVATSTRRRRRSTPDSSRWPQAGSTHPSSWCRGGCPG